MRNITQAIKGNTLTLTVDLSAKTLTDAPNSASGKTRLVASSGGYTPITFTGANGSKLSFALNVTIKD